MQRTFAINRRLSLTALPEEYPLAVLTESAIGGLIGQQIILTVASLHTLAEVIPQAIACLEGEEAQQPTDTVPAADPE